MSYFLTFSLVRISLAAFALHGMTLAEGFRLLVQQAEKYSNSARSSVERPRSMFGDPCYKIYRFSLAGTTFRPLGINTGIPFIKGIGDNMDVTCLWEWEDNNGRCVWIPGKPARHKEGAIRPGCQPNCLHPENQKSERFCVDPDQASKNQLCRWVDNRCMYNKEGEDASLSYIVGSGSFLYENRITPRLVREYYCDQDNWSKNPTPESPAIPISGEGQVRFCYGVGDVSYEEYPFEAPTSVKICPAKEDLQYMLADYFDVAFGGGRSGAKVWGVMCTEPGKPWTCKFVLKAITLKEAMVVQGTLRLAGDPIQTLLMPICAWWLPGYAPLFDLNWMDPEDWNSAFSPMSNDFVKKGIDGGRVWILMPNMGHSAFLPGKSVGGPIDVKGWNATTAKQLSIFSRTNESEFQHEWTEKHITFHTPSGTEHWPTKLSRSLKKLAWSFVSDYSLFFAFAEIDNPRRCKNGLGWPELVLASWMPDRETEWLCVAMSVIDFTKEESDFGAMDAKQTDAIDYAKNMLNMFVDKNKGRRLMGLMNDTFSTLSATQVSLGQGPPSSELISLFTEGEDFLWKYKDKAIKCCVSDKKPTKLQNLNAKNLPSVCSWGTETGCGCLFGSSFHNGAGLDPPTCPVSSQAIMAITGPGAEYKRIAKSLEDYD